MNQKLFIEFYVLNLFIDVEPSQINLISNGFNKKLNNLKYSNQ